VAAAARPVRPSRGPRAEQGTCCVAGRAAAAEKAPVASKNVPAGNCAAATDSARQGALHPAAQSFQNRGEAEAFAAKFGSEKTYLVVSEIPGKGTWYRVRVGDFATAKDAIGGKLAFEKKHGVIAYVAQK